MSIVQGGSFLNSDDAQSYLDGMLAGWNSNPESCTFNQYLIKYLYSPTEMSQEQGI
jgi:hypothetical protein